MYLTAPQTAQAVELPPLPPPIVQEVETVPNDPIASNCFLYVSQFVKLPLQALVVPNSTPYIGVVAIFQYKLPHYAIVEKLTETGFWVKESNYYKGEYSKRFIGWDDTRLRGFYAPPTSLPSK
jgi:hypothetical protein